MPKAVSKIFSVIVVRSGYWQEGCTLWLPTWISIEAKNVKDWLLQKNNQIDFNRCAGEMPKALASFK
jgi:hypothetical protein